MSKRPRYLQVADDLRGRLSLPEWAVGEKLPKIADLMNHYDVPSLGTIRQALGVLAEDGLIETRRSIGSFVIQVPAPPASTPNADDARLAIRRAMAALTDALRALPGEE